MPLFNLVCSECGEETRKLAKNKEEAKGACKICGGAQTWDAQGVSTQTIEKLDNGIMPRAVERHAQAERIYKERAMNADPLSGGANGVKK